VPAVAATVMGAALAPMSHVAYADGSGWYTSAQVSQGRWEFSAGADSWKNPASMQHGGRAAWVTYARGLQAA